jgi:predicted transcriptional regulator
MLTPTTVNLDDEMRRKLDRARKKLARGTIVPSLGQVMRETMSIGIDVVLDGDAHSAKGAPGAAV